jgi:hypothetical protein
MQLKNQSTEECQVIQWLQINNIDKGRSSTTIRTTKISENKP